VVAKFHPATFILTNQSSRAIVGLAVQWVFTDQNGHPGLHTTSSDSFLLLRPNAVVAPHARLLVAPGVFLPESLAQSPHTGPSISAFDGRSAPNVPVASQVVVKIDCVIFEDGEVAGPNQTHYDAEIQSRKIAAEQIAKQVRSAQSRNEDPIPLLRQIAGTRPSSTDFVSVWTVTFANQLLRAPNFSAHVTTLENSPTPPKFFLKTNGGTL
jgi:hypothetical protein